MKVIKSINTNAAICVDDAGNELVALGKGIGFPKCPYFIDDLSVIQRTFYDVNPVYYELLEVLPEEIIEVSGRIIDLYAQTSSAVITPNLVFTLADHIAFTVERVQKNIVIEYPMRYDIRHLYETEYKIGLEAVSMIRKELNIYLPKDEASNIAIHLISSMTSSNHFARNRQDKIIEETTEVISRHFGVYIDKDSYSYSRFVSHMQYLLKRTDGMNRMASGSTDLYDEVRTSHPELYSCVRKVARCFAEEMGQQLNDEEQLYLMMHIHRLCTRETEIN